MVEIQCLQTGKIAESSRDGAGQLVPPQTQFREVLEAGQFSRDGAAKEVVVEIQLRQLREPPESRRDRTREAVDDHCSRLALPPAGEIQLDDAAVGIGLHPEPLPERSVGQPVLGVDPVGTVRRFVELLQRCPLRIGNPDLGRPLSTAGARRDRRHPFADPGHQARRVDRRY